MIPGSPEWVERVRTFINDDGPLKWWWLSFADPERPTGQQFLGFCIIPGANFIQATVNARWLECNPGGEIEGMELPLQARPREKYTFRLITDPEAREVAALSQEELFEWL